MRWTPYKFQLDAVKFLLERGGAGLWLDPGLGKTSIVLAALTALKEAENFKRALVVAPLMVAQNTWPDELRKWDDFHPLRMQVLHGKNKHKDIHYAADVDVINPEGLAWLFTAVKDNRLRWPWDVLVVDESTMFKSWSSLRMKLLKLHLHHFIRRWTLTGTPAPNKLEDVFSQAYIMDGGAALGRYITQFRMRYFTAGGYMNYEWTPNEGSMDDIAEKLSPLVMRLRAKDWIDMPPISYQRLPIELEDEPRRLYNQLEDEFFIELGDLPIMAASAAGLGMKLRQVTNGAIWADLGKGKRDWRPIHTGKLERLEELRDELGDKPLMTVIAFLPERDMIKEKYPNARYLGGRVGPAERKEIIKLWNTGQLRDLIVHPTAVQFGLNLQDFAHHVCFYGLTWNLQEYDQIIRRLWRQGQKHRVFVHHIIVKNTMDEPVLQALGRKDKTQTKFTEAVREYGIKKGIVQIENPDSIIGLFEQANALPV